MNPTIVFRSLSALFLCPFLVAQCAPLACAGHAHAAYGGDHEFGLWAGYSPFSGPVWGYGQNVRYNPIALRYSYLIKTDGYFTLRYAPEVTALSNLYERTPSTTNAAAPVRHLGAGVSPVAFQTVLVTNSRAQPFLSMAGGFIYYADRVLSPQGSQFMYTIDFGTGVNLFTSAHNAFTVGYRYQHLSNANISVHNPGTDADTFYVEFSHFHTKNAR